MSEQSNENDSNVSTRYLSFSLGEEQYAIPLLTVREVIAVPDVTPIPHTPPHFLGLMNLRGQVISVLDLRLKLGIKSQSTSETSIIICDIDPLSVGVVVDSIDSVLAPDANQLSAPPAVQSAKGANYITGICKMEQSLVVLLDIGKALSLEDLRLLKSNVTPAAA